MNVLFALIFFISIYFIIYYTVKRFMTKNKNPDLYTKIKKRVWYATAVLIISLVGIGMTSQDAPTKKQSTRTTVTKVGSADKKKAESKYESIKKEISSKESESESLSKKLNEKESKATSQKESESKVKSQSESSKKLATKKEQEHSNSVQKENTVSNKKQNNSTSTTSSNTDSVTTGGGSIIGNTNSKIYHTPGQTGYKMSKSNAITFQTEQAAQDAGYRKAKK